MTQIIIIKRFRCVYKRTNERTKTFVTLISFFSLPFSLSRFATKGSAFRCIRINGETSEPIIESAAEKCGLSPFTIRRLLPAELTLWVDPYTVCYRIGENGSISVLYDGHRSSPSESLESSGSETCCELSPEINKLVLDLYERQSNSIITKPKRYTKNRQNINNSPPRNNFYQHTFYQSPSNNQYYQNKAF